MRIFVLAPVRLSLLVGVLVLVATVALMVARPPAIRPVVFVPVPLAAPPRAQTPELASDNRPTAELLDGYDAAALAIMNREGLSDRELQLRLMKEIADVTPTVYRLRERERVILWRSPPPSIHGGGARASVFVSSATTWRLAGHVDSAEWTSSVWQFAIDAEQGIAIMVEAYDGLGAPPSRAVAFAVDRGAVVSVEVDRVGDIIIDSSGPEPIVSLRRRVENVNPYSDTPLRGSRWQVRRTSRGLVATETPTTPWIDALAAFCADPAHGNASAEIRSRVAMCMGPTEVRWAAGRRLIATLYVRLRCGEDTHDYSDGELQIAQTRGQWRVVETSPCLPRAVPGQRANE